MFPKLLEVPVINLTVPTYGPMMVIGFLMAVLLMRKLARKVGENPEYVTNVALYALITGVIGARVFYVIHYYDQFRGNFASVFYVWRGGLEFLGGVILAIVIIVVYMIRFRLPARRYMDILTIGLMLGLGFGRIGCFLNGCCFGKPADIPWAVRFPYGSPSYESQVRPDFDRNRFAPHWDLPAEYFGHFDSDTGKWVLSDQALKFQELLKPRDLLTEEQKQEVTKGKYCALKVHPTQLYSSANAFLICLILCLFWRRFGILKSGATFSLMLILYGTSRFFLEFLRDDNPFEQLWWIVYKNGSVSQNIGIYIVIIGLVSIIFFMNMRPPILRRPAGG